MVIPPPPGKARCLVADVEVFPNWWCVVMSNGERYRTFTAVNLDELRPFLLDKNTVIATFNGSDYDDIVLSRLAISPAPTEEEIYTLSSMLIKNDPAVQVEVINGPAPVDQSALVADLTDERDAAYTLLAAAQAAQEQAEASEAAARIVRDNLQAKIDAAKTALQGLLA